MDLVTWLNRIDDALGCVVHVGAGAGAILESYAALPTAKRLRKLVLIEGDPEAARSLERAAAPYASVQVLPTPVAAHSGPMVWNRFSLRTLNGPLDASALTSIYPRLRRTQTTTLHCEAFADVLTTLDLTSSESERLVNALVFDVPGQESLLLAAMPPALLRQFQAVLLRGCRMPLPPNGHVAAAAQERLLQQHFAAAAQQEHEDTLWPEVLMRFDATGYELSHLRQQVARLEAALKESNRAAQELESVTQAKAAAEKLAADRLAKSVEQGDRIRRLDALLADAHARQELLQQEVLMAEGQLALMKDLLFKEPSL